MGGNTLAEQVAVEEELARRRARKGLLSYVIATNPSYEVNWHHRRICQAINALYNKWTHRQLLASWGIADKQLDAMLQAAHPVTGLYAGLTNPAAIDDVITSLHVAIPPRGGKSTISSMAMPAWWLGRNPDTQMLCASYSAGLANKMNRAVQREIDAPEYAKIFPDTRLSGRNVKSASSVSYLRNVDQFEVVDRKGMFRSAGVGGSLTGFGAEVAVCDDVHRNRQDADSPTIRENIWEWYTSTMYTRLHKGAVKLLIMTRWHEADLAGRLLAQAKADPTADQWFALVYPAILDHEPTPGDPRAYGEVLWPSHFPLKQVETIRATIGSYEFEALYQQRPAPREGGIIKTSWLQYYTRLPDGLKDYTLSADLTFGSKSSNTGDFVAIQMWAATGADRYLVDQIHGRMEFTEQIRAIQTMCRKYPQCRVKLIEDAANGRAAISVLRSKIPGLIAVKPIGSKSSRLEAVSPQVESGNVYLPSPKIAPWVQILVHELASFPNASHDDCCDSMSQALNRMSSKRSMTGGLPMGIKRNDAWLNATVPTR
ncbi:MAG: hypothetical protein EOO40_01015 [Deltaproteobacteria bacterium]|nr:MAG: hypothetical protein EOO40_01015 [Deltaproteobacteria bacterium]